MNELGRYLGSSEPEGVLRANHRPAIAKGLPHPILNVSSRVVLAPSPQKWHIEYSPKFKLGIFPFQAAGRVRDACRSVYCARMDQLCA